MGMFDKDKQFAPDGRLDEVYPPGDTDTREGTEFILYGVEDRGDFQTDVGTARMTWLETADPSTPEDKKKVGTLSAPIAAKAAEADPSDFPCLVRTLRVSTDQQDALVIQWVAAVDAKGNVVGEPTPEKSKKD